MNKERKKLVKELDKVFGKVVLLLDKKCVVCGSIKNLQCGHLFSRIVYSTRWDIMNAFTQCRSCNFRHEYDPAPFSLFYIYKFGKETYERLHKNFSTPRKFSNSELRELLKKYKEVLKNYETNGYRALPHRNNSRN